MHKQDGHSSPHFNEEMNDRFVLKNNGPIVVPYVNKVRLKVIAINIAVYVIMGIDKSKSRKGMWRYQNGLFYDDCCWLGWKYAGVIIWIKEDKLSIEY